MAATHVPPGSESAPRPEGMSPWPAPRRPGESPVGMVTVTLFSVVALIAALFGLVLYATDDDTASGAAPVAGGGTRTFDIELGDLYIKPAAIEINAGDTVVLNVTNAGVMQHDLKLNGTTGAELIDPGASATVDLGAINESSQAWCTVPGHKEAGMVLDITVTGEAPAAPATDSAAPAAAASIDPAAKPGPDWHAFDPTVKPAPGGTAHDVKLSASETVLEVAPGVTQQLWTFNGQYPGPTLRGKVGDVFTVTLTNDGEMGHSVDFHASKTPMDVDMRTLQPGESLVYQFTADYAGVWMYHCGTAPALHHIGNGMFGTVIIDPPNLAPVDREVLFVQSELYLGPEGGPGDLAKMQSEAFDAVVFNGYHSQYAYEPIRVEPGQRIRAYVLDAGPSENSSFHIVGTIFDTVYKEGSYLLRPGSADRGGSQSLDLQPAQGGFVEFTLDEAGKYAVVTHKFANPGKGALGFFQAGEPSDGVASH